MLTPGPLSDVSPDDGTPPRPVTHTAALLPCTGPGCTHPDHGLDRPVDRGDAAVTTWLHLTVDPASALRTAADVPRRTGPQIVDEVTRRVTNDHAGLTVRRDHPTPGSVTFGSLTDGTLAHLIPDPTHATLEDPVDDARVTLSTFTPDTSLAMRVVFGVAPDADAIALVLDCWLLKAGH